MEKYKFNSKEIKTEDFYYAYSPIHKSYKKFELCDEYAANYKEGNEKEFDYISLITKKKYKSGTKLTVNCAFGNYGAPLIVITDDVTDGEYDSKIYGLHFEIVSYKDGCNVWNVSPFPERVEHPIKSTKIGFANFEIKNDEMITITAEIVGKKLYIDINGNKIEAEDPNFPDEFHVGITACEGPNRFYDMTIE